MLTLISAAFAAGCDPAVLGPALSGAENAYLNGQPKALAGHLKTASKNLDCDVTPELAARYHRANALRFALENDWATADLHLRAAVAAEPLDPGFVETANDPKLLLAWQRAQEAGVRWSPQAPSLVNGLMLSVKPNVPYLAGGGTTRSKGGSAGPAIRWAALGVGVAAGGLYAGSLASRAEYDRVSGPMARKDDVVPVYNRTNGLFFASVGTAVLASGLLTISFTL